jgi:signal transduction histidine kinase
MKSRGERLAELLASVERMAGGAIEHRIEISSEHDELDALGFAINVVVGELSYNAVQLAHAKQEAERRGAELADAHENLLSKDRLATLGQLAGGVAHQIRNPLAVILNATSLLEHNLPPEQHPDVVSAIGIIREEIRHANTIVTALLDYARLRQPARQPVSLVDLIDRVVGGKRIPTTVSVRRTVDDRVPLAYVDADQLHDAILNLVLNAVEAMPDGGTLFIELTQQPDWIVIAVTDTGTGIPAALESRLFEPLHSTKPMGVGLGLVTARTFVEAHGGRIVAVPLTEGARFEIRLPVGTNAITTMP